MIKTASVVVPPLESPFTYEVPEALSQILSIGARVSVPFGRRTTFGYIVGLDENVTSNAPREYALKAIIGIDGPEKHFHPRQFAFFNWVASYYGASLSEVIEVAVPPSVPQQFEKTYYLNTRHDIVRGAVQLRIVEEIKNAGGSLTHGEIKRRIRGCATPLKKLQDLGVLRCESHELLNSHRSTSEAPEWAKREVSLNDAQKEALGEIVSSLDKKVFSPFLLHGVTGSGKTEVYIEAVKESLLRGKGALIIVPEIALTPQLIDRFQARLGEEIAVLHSALHKRARWDGWRALVDNRARVAIGARSAIFAPFQNLGLIIVDEEHENSYKQSEGLRYHARDLALVRGHQEKCAVVLGSATPSLETYYHARRGKYRYLRLPVKHGSAATASIELVDLSLLKPWEMKSRNISPLLYQRLQETIGRQEQAFILYNRRGFASYLECDRCHQTLDCPHCSVTLTFHKEINSLLCHYCSFSLIPPSICNSCSEKKPPPTGKEPKGVYILRGGGTESVVEELKDLFPEVALERLDRDTVTDTEKYRAILDSVRSGKTQVLVGTQMIAKGHDLPGVTLVGIVDGDVGLHMPDYRASERVFQLLTQASGRAGRAEKKGHIVLQTRVPLHPSMRCTEVKDYEGFALGELRNRKDLLYPPYSRLLRIVVSSSEKTYPALILHSFKKHLVELLEKEKLSLVVLGPAPAPLTKIKSEWRWHMLVRSSDVGALHTALAVLQKLKIKTTKVRIVFDRDPQEML